MPPEFKSMNDLISYLDAVEKRLQALETQNATLQQQNQALNNYIQDLGGDAGKMLPKTSIISPNFLQRAFAIWGHYFVAQLIISIPLACLYYILMTWLFNQVGSLPTY